MNWRGYLCITLLAMAVFYAGYIIGRIREAQARKNADYGDSPSGWDNDLEG